MVQRQYWKDSIRRLITDERNHGSVQVFISNRTEDKPLDGDADALIYSLWVDEAYRGRGVAKHLIEKAETELKSYGIFTVAISWDGRDSPPRVLQWYERLGYNVRVSGYQCSTFFKLL